MKMIGLLAAALCAIGIASGTPQGKEMLTPVLDRFDKRPVRKVLIIGNSRTYYHHMPWMLRQIDDSAGATTRLEITTLAWGGASFEENWKNAGVQHALAQHWDQIVLQPESRSESDDPSHESFSTYGAKLIEAGRATNSPVGLIVNWGYGEELYGADPEARQANIERLEQAERDLASSSGAQIIDTSAVWEKVHAATPDLNLYEDGNHPSIYGSYLSALMLEGYLSAQGVAKETYTPPGAKPDVAATIKTAVANYYNG